MSKIEAQRALEAQRQVDARDAAELRAMKQQMAVENQARQQQELARAAYDKGASDSEASLAAFLNQQVFAPQGALQPEPNTGLAGAVAPRDISPIRSDAPQGVENISYEQARQMGLVD